MRLIDADALKIRDISPSYWQVVDGLTEYDIEDAPTVDAVPVRYGRWLKDPHSQNGFPSHIYMMRKCSECGHSVDNPTPYCPWCGAKMDEERKEE